MKVLHSHKLADDAATARFYQEMRAIGQLHHPNIVSAGEWTEFEPIPHNTNTNPYVFVSLTWSPDGSRLAMSGYLDDGTGVLVMWRLDKSQMPALDIVVPASTSGHQLAWSPGSDWLAAFGGTAPGDKPAD